MASPCAFALSPSDGIVYGNSQLQTQPAFCSPWMRSCLTNTHDIFVHTQEQVRIANIARGEKLEEIEASKPYEENPSSAAIDAVQACKHLYPVLRSACREYTSALKVAANEALSEAQLAADVAAGEERRGEAGKEEVIRIHQQLAMDADLEGQALRLAACVVQASEIACLHPDATIVLQFCLWLRECWMTPADSEMVSQVLHRMAQQTSAVDIEVHGDVWDMVTQLVAEGQPQEASKYLSVLAGLLRDPAIVELAALLDSFPPLSSVSGELGARTLYTSAWHTWQQRAREALESRDFAYHPPAIAVLSLLTGDIHGVLQTFTPHGPVMGAVGDPAPLWRWSYVLLCSVLYGRPAVEVRRSQLAIMMMEALAATGVDISSEDAEAPDAVILSSFVKLFQGNAGEAIALAQKVGQTSVAACLADVFWHAGLLYAETVWPGWQAGVRPQLLMDLAAQWLTLDTSAPYLAWQSISFARATLSPVLSSQYGGIQVGSTGALHFEIVTCSGACAAAEVFIESVIERMPLESEKDVFRVKAVCNTHGFHDLGNRVERIWARGLMRSLAYSVTDDATPSGNFGNALRWLLKCEDDGNVEKVVKTLSDAYFGALAGGAEAEAAQRTAIHVDAALRAGFQTELSCAHVIAAGNLSPSATESEATTAILTTAMGPTLSSDADARVPGAYTCLLIATRLYIQASVLSISTAHDAITSALALLAQHLLAALLGHPQERPTWPPAFQHVVHTAAVTISAAEKQIIKSIAYQHHADAAVARPDALPSHVAEAQSNALLSCLSDEFEKQLLASNGLFEKSNEKDATDSVQKWLKLHTDATLASAGMHGSVRASERKDNS